jgi:hypothetical protein
MLKIIVLGAALVGGAYAAGVFDHHYERLVDRPPADVAAALSSLDIRQAPGAPATDQSRSGGLAPTFTHERSSSGITYTVFSGSQIAVRMFADLEAIDGGKRTKVTTRVERGDAPDDFVAPAFRSKGITTGLFNMVVEADLDKLTARKGDPERCRELNESFQSRSPDLDAMHQDNLKDAAGDTARSVIRLGAMQQELRSAGCDDNNSGEFKPVEEKMKH